MVTDVRKLRSAQQIKPKLKAANAEESRRVLLRGATIISMDIAVPDMTAGDILIEGKKIAAVAPDLSEAMSDSLVLDAGGTIAIPGLHDTHRHCWQGQFRSLVPDVGSNEKYLTETHFGLATRYEPEDLFAGNLISALGAIDAGITTILDFSHNSRSPEHSDAAIEALAAARIRAVHASGPPFGGEWAGSWPADLGRLRDQHFSSDDQLLTLRMGVLASPDFSDLILSLNPGTSVTKEQLGLSPDSLALARDLGIGIAAEALYGEQGSENVVSLNRQGLLGPDVLMIHCLDLTREAWEAPAASETAISLVPACDAQIGQVNGVIPIQEAIDAGVTPTMSVDVEVTVAADLFSQMRAVLGFQRSRAAQLSYAGDENAPTQISSREVLSYGTIGGAKALNLDGKVGSLPPGKEADIVLVRSDEVNTMPLNNAIGTIVTAASARNVDTVFVAGEVRKWRGELFEWDMHAVRDLVTASRDRVSAAAGRSIDILA